MDAFVKLFKMFFDKSSKKTILAIIITFIVYYVTPNNFPMLVKFTVVGYLIFCFLILFLILSPIFVFCNNIKNALGYAASVTIETDKLWNIIDNIPRNEQKIIFELLERDNEPIELIFGLTLSQHIEDWFCREKVYGAVKDIFWLKEDKYRLLKNSMRSYKKKYDFVAKRNTKVDKSKHN